MQWHYIFRLDDDKTLQFDVELDDKTLSFIAPARSFYPSWTRLSYHQCGNCPLQEQTHPQCPIAANLTNIIEYFQDIVSYATVEVEIVTQYRTYQKTVAVQEALSSLIGIYMATSGCPIMDKLRPLVKTHLPFASLGENTFRVVSMYLMAQYFRQKRGEKPDWELDDLVRVYDDIQTVNRHFHRRITEFMSKDSVVNAIARLDTYAEVAREGLSSRKLDDMEYLFASYLPATDQSED